MADPPRPSSLNDESVRLLVIVGGGCAAVFGVMSTALWLSRAVAGGGWDWPSPATVAGATVGGLNGRVDEWMLVNTDTTAFVSPVWFWLLAVALFALAASAATLGWQAMLTLTASDDSPAERERKAKARKQTKQQRRAADSTRVKTWPIPPPYHPVRRPGPGVLLGRVRHRCSVSRENTPVLIIGPTGSGKTRNFGAPNLAHWPGPVVATSVKLDLAELTVNYRAEAGNVWGFDPSGRQWAGMRAMGITPTVWDPVRLLHESTQPEADSILLSTFLMSQTSAQGEGSQEIWAVLAKQVMQRLLCLSMPFKADLARVLEWILDPTVLTEIEDEDLPRMTARDRLHLTKLRAMTRKDAKIFDSISVTMTEVAETLAHTAENPTAPLVPIGLTTDGTSDTLYLAADHMSQNSHKPLFAAVCRHLFHATESFTDSAQFLHLLLQAQESEQRTISSETGDSPSAEDPMLHATQDAPVVMPTRSAATVRPLFCLDEMANLAPLKDMPQIMSTIRARAQVITLIQEISQLKAVWGQDGATAMITNHPTLVQLGGSGDASSMRALAELSGLDDAETSDMRMIDRDIARVVMGTQIAFEIDLIDADKWIDPKRVAGSDIEAEIEKLTEARSTDPAQQAPPAAPPTPPASPAAPAGPPLAPRPPSRDQAQAWQPDAAAAHAGEDFVAAASAALPATVPPEPDDGLWPPGEWHDAPPIHARGGGLRTAPPSVPAQAGQDEAALRARESVERSARRRTNRLDGAEPFHLDTARAAAARTVRRSRDRRRSPRLVHAAVGDIQRCSEPADSRSDYRPSPPDLQLLGTPPPDDRPAGHDAQPHHASEPAPQPTSELAGAHEQPPPPEPVSAAAAAGPVNPLVAPSRSELLRVGAHMLTRTTPPGHSPEPRALDLVAETLSTAAETVTADDLRDTWNTIHHEEAGTV